MPNRNHLNDLAFVLFFVELGNTTINCIELFAANDLASAATKRSSIERIPGEMTLELCRAADQAK